MKNRISINDADPEEEESRHETLMMSMAHAEKHASGGMVFGGHLSSNYIAKQQDPNNERKYLQKEKAEGAKAPLKYQPKWWFIIFLIVMLSVQSLHSGYGMGTWNRIGPMLRLKYGWTPGERKFYESFVTSFLIGGIVIGRFFGAWFVQKGRKTCLLTACFVGLVAIAVMQVQNIYLFIFGRLIYGFSAGAFNAVGGRYVEECSPPQYLSLFFTLYTFGVSLNRPAVVLGTLLLEKSKDPAVLIASDSWHYFILMPVIFSTICIFGTIFVVRYETPMYLVTKRRYDEARAAIKLMFSSDVDPEDILRYLKRNTSKETDKASFKSALVDPRYRIGTLITSSLALMLFFNGIFPITTFGADLFTAIYGSDYSYFDSQDTLNIIAIADPVSQLVAVFIVPLFSRRLFLIGGGLIIAVMNAMVVFFDQSNQNLAVTITVVSLVIITSIVQEPVCQLYMQEVSSNSSLGIVHLCYYLSTFVLAAALPTVLAELGPSSIYGACCVMSLILVVIQFFFIKETCKLTDKEKKQLYFPPEFKSKIQSDGDTQDTSQTMDMDHSVSMSLRSFA